MAWGKEWHNEPIPEVNPPAGIKQLWPFKCQDDPKGDIDFGLMKFKTQGSNLVDNNQYLYFQCNECLDIFDPHTKSFATLNQKRHEAGWKVKWNLDGMGYKVYCVKCGEDEK